MINNTYIMHNTLYSRDSEHLLPLTEGDLIIWLEITEGRPSKEVGRSV